MYADKGWVVLLLTLSVAVAHKTGWPRSKTNRTYRPNMGPRRLIQHVMMHEVQWANVLKERVKVLGDPPHGGSLNEGPTIQPPPKPKPVVEEEDNENKEITDIIDTDDTYTVGDIVSTVARHYIGVRSFVEYGAKALRLGTSCYAMRQLMVQFSNISLLMTKESSALDVVAAVMALKKNAAAYIDALAFWPHDDITVLHDVYWEAVDIIQDKRIQTLIQTRYPIEMIQELEKHSEYLEKLVDEQCDLIGSEDEILRDMGIEKRPPLIIDPYLDILIQFKDLKHMSLKQTEHVNWYIKNLKINTMPTRMWSSVFLSKGSLEETRSGLSETTAKVEKELSEAHPKTGQTSFGHSVESSTDPSTEDSGSADTP